MRTVGKWYRVNLPGHETHGQLALVKLASSATGWNWARAEDEAVDRCYRDENLEPIEPEHVNPGEFETATGALR